MTVLVRAFQGFGTLPGETNYLSYTLVNGLLVWWMPELARTATTDPLTLSSIVGGFLFGAGAAVNGGCSFSTLSKIAQGDLHVAFTLPAFVAGVVLASKVLPGTGMMDRAMSLPRLNDDLRTVLLGALALWALCYVAVLILTWLQAVPGTEESSRYGTDINLEYPVFLMADPESEEAQRHIAQLSDIGGNLRTVLLSSESEEAARFTPARYKRRIGSQGTPITWASAIAGWVYRNSSITRG